MNRRWVARAACGDADPALFDTGDRSKRRAAEHAAEAKALCAQCPVRALCLHEQVEFEAAAAYDPPFGIWGGLEPDERLDLIQERARARKKVA